MNLPPVPFHQRYPLLFDLRRLALQQEQHRAILDHGWTIVAVFPNEGSDQVEHFAYTIGRHFQGHPELILTGMSQSAEPMFEVICGLWDDITPRLGVSFTIGVGADDDGRFVLAPVPDEERRRRMTMTRSMVGEDFEAWQMIWQDDDGRWPWDEGHARQLRMDEGDTMPILAGDDWRPTS